jgi:methane monooxygenase component A beta chain/propane monooxygenase small subunit
VSTGERRRAEPNAFYSQREVTHVRPAGRRLTDYESVICGTQPDLGTEDQWCPLSPDGLGVLRAASTRLQHPDWSEYRDPSGMWQRPYVRHQAGQERMIDELGETAAQNDTYLDIDTGWAGRVLAPYYEGYACLEWGLFMALSRGVRHALSDTVTMTMTFAAIDHLRHQQAIALASLDLDQFALGYQQGRGKVTWLEDPAYQPARALIERLMITEDWCETWLVVALLVEPLLATFVLSRFFRRVAPLNGDIVTPLITQTAERDRARHLAAATELLTMVLSETDRADRPVPRVHNLAVVQEWVDEWTPMVLAAMDAFVPVYALPVVSVDATSARRSVVSGTAERLAGFGLRLPA